MTTKELVAVVTLLGILGTMWWQLGNKIDTDIHTLNTKVERMNALLTDNLIALNRDVGALNATSHSHTP